MAKKVLRYTEEEFVTLLESIVKKVKSEQKRLDESKRIPNRNGRVRENTRPNINESNRIERRESLNNRFKKLK